MNLENASDHQIERFDPSMDEPDLACEHWHRYILAGRLVSGKRVLDVACGTGYGSDYLAETASKVVGVDVDAATIAAASTRYPRSNLCFLIGQADRIPFHDARDFDVVVSFETIEHLDSEQQDRFLDEVRRVLKADGMLLISTPDKDRYSKTIDNRYHRHELNRDTFSNLLSTRFRTVRLYGQKVFPASLIWPLVSSCRGFPGNTNSIAPTNGEMRPVPSPGLGPLYLVAMCSDNSDYTEESSLLIDRECRAFSKREEQLIRQERDLRTLVEQVRTFQVRAGADKEAYAKLESGYRAISDQLEMVTSEYRRLESHAGNLAATIADLRTASEAAATARAQVAEHVRHLEHELEARDAEHKRLESAYRKLLAYADRVESELHSCHSEFARIMGCYLEAKKYVKHLEEHLAAQPRNPGDDSGSLP